MTICFYAGYARTFSNQFCHQRLGLLQVFGVKAFGEPVINVRQHLAHHQDLIACLGKIPI